MSSGLRDHNGFDRMWRQGIEDYLTHVTFRKITSGWESSFQGGHAGAKKGNFLFELLHITLITFVIYLQIK